MTEDEAINKLKMQMAEPLTKEEVWRRCTRKDGSFDLRVYRIILRYMNYKK